VDEQERRERQEEEDDHGVCAAPGQIGGHPFSVA
jgi:hypothetical protein